MQGFGFKRVSNPSEMIRNHLPNSSSGAVHYFVRGKWLAMYMNSIYVTGYQCIYLTENTSIGKYVIEQGSGLCLSKYLVWES